MGTARAGAVGTAGADPTGGLGTNGAFGPDDSVSFRYDAFWFATYTVSYTVSNLRRRA